MTRFKLEWLLLTLGLVSPTLGQQPVVQEPTDLQVQFQSATGSNRFRVGEVIPLEVVVSSTTPNRYLEPCDLFDESGFGFPQCRFSGHWSFAITPSDGWVDFGGPRQWGGPTFGVPNPDLTSKPVTFPYRLSHRYRIDKPGEYRVSLSMQIGLDDETTQLRPRPDPSIHPHSVRVTREIVLQVAPAEPEWQAEIIRKGEEAYASPRLPDTNPPSRNSSQYQQATQALCTLGTPEAVRVVARLLAEGRNEVRTCLERSANRAAAIDEMRRLLVEPDTAVTPTFFDALVKLLYNEEAPTKGTGNIAFQKAADTERDALFASLEQKRGSAQYSSLVPVLQTPVRVLSDPEQPAYELPFPQAVIFTTAEDFDNLAPQSQEWLMRDAWDRVRSPLMLPVVRRKAEAGDGSALLRWSELDPATAVTFIREEIVRPEPRFSSHYLRLPDKSLAGQERQIAANFIALTDETYLANAATLLHRYATRAVLPKVLPFMDAKLAEWPCSIRLPVLAYLLKVAPKKAAPRVAQVLKDQTGARACSNALLTDLGYLQPSPVLEQLAIAQVEVGGAPALDGAHYLRWYGSPGVKPRVWELLQRWHQSFVDSGAEKRVNAQAGTKDDVALSDLVRTLTETFVKAQGWLLTPEEADRMQTLLGKQTVSSLSCSFQCGVSFGISASTAAHSLYGRANKDEEGRESPMEYLNPVERLYYSVAQYRCADLRALKQKLLQFPKGSTFAFAFAEDFTAQDRDELIDISDFLSKHDYKLKSTQDWAFLLPGPPHTE
jgi:hypothetical protein